MMQLADGTEVRQCEGHTYNDYRRLYGYNHDHAARCRFRARYAVHYPTKTAYFCGVHVRGPAKYNRVEEL